MKAEILACRTQGWNFRGGKTKAEELQLLCDAYEKNASSQIMQQFISLAIRPRPFFSFSLFGYKFEFRKATSGNTNSAIAFNGVLTAAAATNVVEQAESSDDNELPSQEESDDESSYMAIQNLIKNPSKPSETTLELPLTPTNDQASDYSREVSDIIAKLNSTKTCDEAGPLM